MKKVYLVIILVMLLPTMASAAITDNLDSYSTGDLNGQGSWSGDATWDIQTTTVQSSPNAAQNAGSVNGAEIKKSFTAEATGNQIVYLRSSGVSAGNTDHRFWLYEGATRLGRVKLNGDGNIYLSGSADPAATLTTWSVNTWYKVEIEWKASDDTIRARVNDGTWSSYVAAAAAFANADGVGFQYADGSASGSFFFDSLSVPTVASVTTSIVGLVRAFWIN